MKLNKKYFVQIHEWMANTTTERSFLMAHSTEHRVLTNQEK
jgi:hypothetical protein